MLKGILGLLLLVLSIAPTNAASSPASGGQAQDDRYFNTRAYEKTVAKKHPPQAGKRAPQVRRVARSVPRAKEARIKYRRTVWRSPQAGKVAVHPPQAGERPIVHGGRPAGCPARAWCGCWLQKHFGISGRDLWLARNWARVGRPSSPQGANIAVWRHHVGKVIAVAFGRIKLLSGNDGRAVRERWRSARGVIAYRLL